jgi:hypothetical protein
VIDRRDYNIGGTGAGIDREVAVTLYVEATALD